MNSLPVLRRILPNFSSALIPIVMLLFWFSRTTHSIAPWHISLVLAVAALLAWVFLYRRYRQYADTPSAPISSAPQGYVAIRGIGRALAGEPLRSPFNYLPCLWYRVHVEVRDSDGEWRTELDDTSIHSFILEDTDGTRCTIDPDGAHIETLNKDHFKESDRRTTQWLLIPGTRLYATGNFITRRPIDDRDSLNAELREKLAEWKDTGRAKRFDLDGNGLDMHEWEQAREAARQEVEQEREAAADFPAYHTLSAPPDNRPFVVADHDPRQVIRRYHLQAWACLLLFFALLLGSVWLAAQP